MTSLFYIRMLLVNFNVFSCFVLFCFFFGFCLCFLFFSFIAIDSRHLASSKFRCIIISVFW